MQAKHSIVSLATVATLAAGSVIADTRSGNTETMWERGQLLAAQQAQIDARGDVGSVSASSWERGQLLDLIRQSNAGDAGSDSAATAPRVIIYFDEAGTTPGLPHDLGNTDSGRSIMLKYLEQAHQAAKS